RQALHALLKANDVEGLPLPTLDQGEASDVRFLKAAPKSEERLEAATAFRWLTLLRHGQRLAARIGDSVFAHECDDAFARAAAAGKRFGAGPFAAERLAALDAPPFLESPGSPMSSTSDGAIRLSQAADWNALYREIGFALDMDAGSLTLAVPTLPGPKDRFIAP